MKRAAVFVAALFLLAGCGGDDDGDEAGGGATATAGTTQAGGTTEAGGVDGAAVFASAGCGGCHTLAAAGSSGSVGPDLDQVDPSVERVAEQVRTGGGGMPSFADRLSDEEIQAVAEYVAQSAGG